MLHSVQIGSIDRSSVFALETLGNLLLDQTRPLAVFCKNLAERFRTLRSVLLIPNSPLAKDSIVVCLWRTSANSNR
jgi:hypothetical protein